MESAGLIVELGAKVGAAVLLGLAACGAARRLQLLRLGSNAVNNSLRVVESVSLGQQRALHIVTVGVRSFLLASTASQITLLSEITHDLQASQAFHQTAEPVSFASVLTKLLPAPVIKKSSNQTEWLQAASSALHTDNQRSALV